MSTNRRRGRPGTRSIMNDACDDWLEIMVERGSTLSVSHLSDALSQYISVVTVRFRQPRSMFSALPSSSSYNSISSYPDLFDSAYLPSSPVSTHSMNTLPNLRAATSGQRARHCFMSRNGFNPRITPMLLAAVPRDSAPIITQNIGYCSM